MAICAADSGTKAKMPHYEIEQLLKGMMDDCYIYLYLDLCFYGRKS